MVEAAQPAPRIVCVSSMMKILYQLPSLSQSYQKQANLLWYEIFDIVKQNCTTKFDGSPQDDMMEQLLRSRK